MSSVSPTSLRKSGESTSPRSPRSPSSEYHPLRKRSLSKEKEKVTHLVFPSTSDTDPSPSSPKFPPPVFKSEPVSIPPISIPLQPQSPGRKLLGFIPMSPGRKEREKTEITEIPKEPLEISKEQFELILQRMHDDKVWKTENIFRADGNNETIEKIRNQLQTAQKHHQQFSLPADIDPLVLARLFKEYIKQPFFPIEVQRLLFMNFDDDVKIKEILDTKLSEDKKELLNKILNLILIVLVHSDTNKMTLPALGVCLGQSFFIQLSAGVKEDWRMKGEAKAAMQIFNKMIKNYCNVNQQEFLKSHVAFQISQSG